MSCGLDLGTSRRLKCAKSAGREAKWKSSVTTAFRRRRKTLGKRCSWRNRASKEEFDAADGLSVHLVAFDCGKPVATCRFYRKADTASFVLGRIAVVKECRGRHIGARLIAYAEDMLKNEADFILIHAQTRVRSFYEKQGYTAFGEEDFEEDCQHVWMKKRLRRD